MNAEYVALHDLFFVILICDVTEICSQAQYKVTIVKVLFHYITLLLAIIEDSPKTEPIVGT